MICVALAYIALISVAAIVLTVADKIAARRGGERVPERTLLFIGWVGGAAAMLTIMLAIRHKTKKAKFMILLPTAIVIHVIAVILFIKYFG